MAIELLSSKWNSQMDAYVVKYLLDSADDLANVPQCAPSSMAIVAEGGKSFVVNPSGAWVEHGSPIASAIDDYMEEALGGDY